jgi:hypothetical protein
VSPSSSTSSSDSTGQGDARRFFLGTLLPIVAALVLIGATNYVIDPFGMNAHFDLGLHRERVSRILNYRLYKTLEFRRNPRTSLVLGDSRCDLLRAEYFERAGRPGVYNMSFGGGTVSESIDAFWFAVEQTHLASVVICISFASYSEGHQTSRVPEAIDLLSSPLGYYLAPFTSKASFALVHERLTGTLLTEERPDMSHAEFWEHQLGPEVAGGALKRWRRPDILERRLAEVANYCRANGIALTFLIPPDHVDLQAKIDEFGLRSEYARMKERLASLAPLADFGRPSELTRDSGNYKDPFHLTPEAAERFVGELVRKTPQG